MLPAFVTWELKTGWDSCAAILERGNIILCTEHLCACLMDCTKYGELSYDFYVMFEKAEDIYESINYMGE